MMRTQIFNPANGDRQGIKDIAIVITDGRSNVNPERVASEVQLAKAAGIELFSVGITDEVDADELRLIATDPDSSHVFEVRQA